MLQPKSASITAQLLTTSAPSGKSSGRPAEGGTLQSDAADGSAMHACCSLLLALQAACQHQQSQTSDNAGQLRLGKEAQAHVDSLFKVCEEPVGRKCLQVLVQAARGSYALID